MFIVKQILIFILIIFSCQSHFCIGQITRELLITNDYSENIFSIKEGKRVHLMVENVKGKLNILNDSVLMVGNNTFKTENILMFIKPNIGRVVLSSLMVAIGTSMIVISELIVLAISYFTHEYLIGHILFSPALLGGAVLTTAGIIRLTKHEKISSLFWKFSII